ncbi:Hypothetical_protein [Hexamita inflata]|uniref:Hypothetical_protein n=1 Tax=Hexamita inflata TaxID=28002 RepID=A0ABP1IKF5_9EUKA
MISTTTNYNQLGIFGRTYGNTSLQEASITLSVISYSFWCVGIIGFQYSVSQYAQIQSILVSVNFDGSNRYGGAIFGVQQARNCYIANISIINSSIILYNEVGGIIGQTYQVKTTIINSSVTFSNISGFQCVGGFIGSSFISDISITSSKLEFVRLTASVYVSIVLGYNEDSTIILFSSYSNQNYVNNEILPPCLNLTNTASETGC